MNDPGEMIPPVSFHQITNTKVIRTRKSIISMLKGRPINFMEIGTGSGDFSNDIINNLNIEKATIIDIFIRYPDIHKRHLPEEQESFVRNRFSDNKRVNIIKGDSHIILPELYTSDNTRYDFIYLDADHSIYQISNDLNWASKIIKDDGIIGIDDFCFKPSFLTNDDGAYEAQQAVMTFLKNNPEWKIKYFSFNDGGFQNIFISKQW